MLKVYQWPEAYFNKALSSYKLGDHKSFCHYLLQATHWGDEEAQKLFTESCTTIDTVYRNGDSIECPPWHASFYEVITGRLYSNYYEYRKYANDTLVVSYYVESGDTIYYLHPYLIKAEYPGVIRH